MSPCSHNWTNKQGEEVFTTEEFQLINTEEKNKVAIRQMLKKELLEAKSIVGLLKISGWKLYVE
jgi:hypothetical protein